MIRTVAYGNIDALLGMTFAGDALANVTATYVGGSITNTAASNNEVLTYAGLTGVIGAALIAQSNVTYDIVAVSDSDDSVVIDVYAGASFAAELDYTVAGFSNVGIALAALPLDSLVTQAGNLAGLNGSLFVLGTNAADAANQSVTFGLAGTTAIMPGATVRYATAASPLLMGTHGSETLIAVSGDDRITGGSGKTLIYGGPGNDVLIAGSGVTTIYGGDGYDTIYGGSWNNTIYAGNGGGVIHAGTGTDVMIGGTGADRFVFERGHTGGLSKAAADVIQDFHRAQGDVIDFSAFDALLPADGSAHFTFIGNAAFDGHAGELRYSVSGTSVMIYGDVTGNGTADFAVSVTRTASLIASDFIL